VSHCGEGKFFDNSNQTPEARPNYPQDLEGNLGVRHTQGLKILFADEQQSCIVNRGGRCRIVPAIEHR